MNVRVLVVEDEEVAAAAHASYVGRVAGFTLAGVARTGREAMLHLAREPVDLILLDIHLPDGHGLDLLRQIRGQGHLSDVIAVTSARDLAVVKQAVAQGIVSYLVKPFTFAGFRTKLEQYARYQEQFEVRDEPVEQHAVDQVIGMLRSPAGPPALPKGMSATTLDDVTRTVHQRFRDGGSATEVAAWLGASRVTARRYLEYLADAGVVTRATRYGGSGRPEIEYRPNA